MSKSKYIITDITIPELTEECLSSYRDYVKYKPGEYGDFQDRMQSECKSGTAKNNLESLLPKVTAKMREFQERMEDPKERYMEATKFKQGTSSYCIMEQMLEYAYQRLSGMIQQLLI